LKLQKKKILLKKKIKNQKLLIFQNHKNMKKNHKKIKMKLELLVFQEEKEKK
jgi:hypothetical protein